MKKIRKLVYPLTIVLLIIVIISIFIVKKYLNKNKYNDIEIVDNIIDDEITKTDKKTNEENTEETIEYNIDIKGAVNNPGVYKVESNLTVNDVINIAGGLKENADTSVINLAKKITDEMVIIIYTKEEVKNSNIVDTVIKVVEKECVCPNIENDGCLNTEIKDEISIKDDNKETNGLININTATIEELKTINGIGESKAKSIIEYRSNVGKFKSIEDLKNVDGIGDTLYEAIKIYITT